VTESCEHGNEHSVSIKANFWRAEQL